MKEDKPMTEPATGAIVPKSAPRKSPSRMERTLEMVEKHTQNDETFNLIARSLLNVSDQVPNMVRDMAELKVHLIEIKMQQSELKAMMQTVNNNLMGFQEDITNIARATGAIPGVLNLNQPPRRMQQAPGAPTADQLRDAMRAVPGVDKI